MAPSDRYTKTRSVGSGAFGEVFLVKDTRSGEQVIMKEVSLAGLPPRERASTMQEVKVLQRVKHKGVVEFRDSFTSGDKLCIVMEWASGGDLGKLIKQRKRSGKRFTEAEIVRICSELVEALAYCHHELKLLHRYVAPLHVLHAHHLPASPYILTRTSFRGLPPPPRRDLKPANIFLGAKGEVKLGDFGISKTLASSCQLAQTQCGTPLYMSPEMCRGQQYSRAADVWAGQTTGRARDLPLLLCCCCCCYCYWRLLRC